jgi:hypothetical protein
MSAQERNMAEFAPGSRVIYARIADRRVTDVPAIYVRSQITAGRKMHVIQIAGAAGRIFQVGERSIRMAP